MHINGMNSGDSTSSRRRLRGPPRLKRPEALAQCLSGRRLAIGKIRDNGGSIRHRPESHMLQASGVWKCAAVSWVDMMALVASSQTCSSPTTGAAAASGRCSKPERAASLFCGGGQPEAPVVASGPALHNALLRGAVGTWAVRGRGGFASDIVLDTHRSVVAGAGMETAA